MLIALASALVCALVVSHEGDCLTIPDTSASGDESALEAQRVLELYDNLQQIPRPLKRSGREELQRATDKLLIACTSYLKKYPTASTRPQITYVFVKTMSLNFQRHLINQDNEYRLAHGGTRAPREYLDKSKTQYLTKAITLLDEALQMNITADLRCDLQKLKGYCFYLDGKHRAAAAAYELVLSEFPDDAETDKSLGGLIQSLLRAARERSDSVRESDLTAAVDACDVFLERFQSSRLFPHVVNLRGRALSEMGDPAAALAHWDKYEKLLQASHMTDASAVLDRVDFRKAPLYYALGDSDRALESMNRATKSWRRSGAVRSSEHPLARFLRHYHGHPAPPLDIADSWVDRERFDVATEKGNVVALFFCPYGSHADFARFLERFCRENWPDGFRTALIAYRKTRGTLESELLHVGQWRRRLDCTYAFGLDVTDRRNVYQHYNARVGLGTLVVIDREGKFAWYRGNLAARDIGLARQVFWRLLDAKRP